MIAAEVSEKGDNKTAPNIWKMNAPVKVVDEIIPGLKMSDRIDGVTTKLIPLTIQFVNLSVENYLSGVSVLKGVSGVCFHSHVMGILGPAASGKRALLSTLAGRSTGVLSGDILYNGKRVNPASMRRTVGFVPQQTILCEELTVRENLSCSARLRLPRNTKPQHITVIVDGVLKALDLFSVESLLVGSAGVWGINNGQRVRTAIAMELVTDPVALFLDDPMHGLSFDSSGIIMKALRSLACVQCNIVMVLRQPRFVIYDMMHTILLLSKEGEVCYNGGTESAKKYFETLGFPLHQIENPADFFLDAISGYVAPSETFMSTVSKLEGKEMDDEVSGIPSSLSPLKKKGSVDNLTGITGMSTALAKTFREVNNHVKSSVLLDSGHKPAAEDNKGYRNVTLKLVELWRELGPNMENIQQAPNIAQLLHAAHMRRRYSLQGRGLLKKSGQSDLTDEMATFQESMYNELTAMKNSFGKEVHRGWRLTKRLLSLGELVLKDDSPAAGSPVSALSRRARHSVDNSMLVREAAEASKNTAEATLKVAFKDELADLKEQREKAASWKAATDDPDKEAERIAKDKNKRNMEIMGDRDAAGKQVFTYVPLPILIDLMNDMGLELTTGELKDILEFLAMERISDERVGVSQLIGYVNRLHVLYSGCRAKLGNRWDKEKVRFMQKKKKKKKRSNLDLLMQSLGITKRLLPPFVGENPPCPAKDQFWWLAVRTFLQYHRMARTHLLNEAVVLAFGGTLVGMLLESNDDIEYVPNNAIIAISILGVISSVSTVPLFGAERVLALHERSAGVDTTMYLLAKNLPLVVEAFWQSGVFLAAYYNYLAQDIGWATYWGYLILVAWISSGIGMTFSLVFQNNSKGSLIGAVGIPLFMGFIANGVYPSIQDAGHGLKVIDALSHCRWATELVTGRAWNLYGAQNVVRKDTVDSLYDDIGYKHFSHDTCVLWLLGIGTSWRLIGHACMFFHSQYTEHITIILRAAPASENSINDQPLDTPPRADRRMSFFMEDNSLAHTSGSSRSLCDGGDGIISMDERHTSSVVSMEGDADELKKPRGLTRPYSKSEARMLNHMRNDEALATPGSPEVPLALPAPESALLIQEGIAEEQGDAEKALEQASDANGDQLPRYNPLFQDPQDPAIDSPDSAVGAMREVREVRADSEPVNRPVDDVVHEGSERQGETSASQPLGKQVSIMMDDKQAVQMASMPVAGNPELHVMYMDSPSSLVQLQSDQLKNEELIVKGLG
eukprot:gene6012-7224_t